MGTPKLHVQCSSRERKTDTKFPFLRCSQVFPPNKQGQEENQRTQKTQNQNLAPQSIKVKKISGVPRFPTKQTGKERRTQQNNNIPVNLSKAFSVFQQTTINLYMIQREKRERRAMRSRAREIERVMSGRLASHLALRLERESRERKRV